MPSAGLIWGLFDFNPQKYKSNFDNGPVTILFVNSNEAQSRFMVDTPILLISIPTFLVFSQPDLGTSLLILISGLAVMFLAGVSIWYFVLAFAGIGLISSVF